MYVGFTGGTNAASIAPLYIINSFSYLLPRAPAAELHRTAWLGGIEQSAWPWLDDTGRRWWRGLHDDASLLTTIMCG